MEAGGKPIRIVVHGDAGDRTHLTEALKRIVDYQVSLMGDAPFHEFLFLFHVGPDFGGGGMEHANSTAIAADAPGHAFLECGDGRRHSRRGSAAPGGISRTMTAYPKDHKELAAAWFAALRDRICAAFEAIESDLAGTHADLPAGRFERQAW